MSIEIIANYSHVAWVTCRGWRATRLSFVSIQRTELCEYKMIKQLMMC